MTRKYFHAGVMAAGLGFVSGITPVAAQLPALNEKDWLGYFVGTETRNFQFGITADGDASIKIFSKKNEPIGGQLAIPVDFRIEETMPGGKIVARKIKPESLESAQQPTTKPKDVVIKGLVTGDIEFEIFFTEQRGGLSLSGRLLDPGALKNPTRFCIAVKIPSIYANQKTDGDKKEKKAFEEKIKDDRVQINRKDGKREKFSTTEPVDGGSAEVTGPGLDSVLIEVSTYQGKKILLTASPNSSMALKNGSKQALGGGFSVVWAADLAKDLKNEARLQIDIK
jgi:hypothetical protein